MSNEVLDKQSYRDELAAAVDALKNPPAAEQDPCDPCPDADESFSFCAGNYDVSYNAITGKMSRKERDNPVDDGWYDSVRVVDGCIVEYKKEGKNVTVLQADCCKDDDSADLTDPIALMNSKCNLSYHTDDGMMTKFEWVECDKWAVQKGCGTKEMPYGFSIPWDDVRDSFLECGITTKRCGIDVQDGLIKALPAKIITGFVNESEDGLNIWCDDQCRLHIELKGAGGSGSGNVVYEEQLNCSINSIPTTGNVGDPCEGNGVLAIDTSASGTAQVLESASGTYYIRVNGGPAFCTDPPNSFDTVAQAQTWIQQNREFVCGCPTVCEGGA